jgi:hypothetical protein
MAAVCSGRLRAGGSDFVPKRDVTADRGLRSRPRDRGQDAVVLRGLAVFFAVAGGCRPSLGGTRLAAP